MANRNSKHTRLWSRLGWSCALATVSVAAATVVELQSMASDQWTDTAGQTNIVFGNAGNDHITGGPGIDILSGNAGDDKIYAGASGGYLFGGAGDDYLEGSDGADQMLGGSGSDTLIGGGRNDSMHGDMFEYPNPLGGDTPSDWIVQFVNGNVSITLNGTTYGPTDMIHGVLKVTGVVPKGEVTEGGDDLLQGGPGNDKIYGDGGIDTVSYSAAQTKANVSLADGKATDDGDYGTDTLTSIENVIGSAHDDTIIGDDNVNQLDGGNGHDTLEGRKGNDTLIGGAGNDRFVFAPGDGNDTIKDYSAGDIIDTLAFGFNGDITERIINNSKVITIGGNVVVTLEDYTGSLTLDFQQLSAD